MFEQVHAGGRCHYIHLRFKMKPTCISIYISMEEYGIFLEWISMIEVVKTHVQIPNLICILAFLLEHNYC